MEFKFHGLFCYNRFNVARFFYYLALFYRKKNVYLHH